MSAIVRCTVCEQRSRVDEAALGLLVACPRCGNQFVAQPQEPLSPAAPPVPTVHPRRNADGPRPTPLPPSDEPIHHPAGPNGFLVSVALLPLGIPLLWLFVSAVTGRETLLSFAAPLAIAIGICGLCGGIALTHWSTPARIRAMLALVALAYCVSGALFFLKESWLIEVFKNFGVGEGGWREFAPPGKAYSVQFPGNPTEQDVSPIEGWSLKAFRYSDPRRPAWPVTFVSADGPPPKDMPKGVPDDVWFAKAKEALLISGARVVRDEPVRSQDFPAREYELRFPEGQIRRVVRIVRTKSRVFYLSVDGPFHTADFPDVKAFMKSFTLKGKP